MKNKLNLHKETLKTLKIKSGVKTGAEAGTGFSRTCPAVCVQLTEDCPPSKKL